MNLICGHSEPFLETWPSSGTTRNGVACEQQTWAHPTGDTGSSLLLKTPTSQLAVNGGSQHPDKRKLGGHGPTLADEVEHLLPTPRAEERMQHNSADSGKALSLEVTLLPTPAAMDGIKAPKYYAGGNPSLPHAVTLLPTPTTTQRGPDARQQERPEAEPNLHNAVEQLLPSAVQALLYGVSTEPQSSGGNGSSAA